MLRVVCWMALLPLVVSAWAASTSHAADPFPTSALATRIGGGLPGGFESSDLLWHTRLDRLFVVDDGGNVASMKGDGTDVQSWSLPGDLEGICVANPNSNFVYVGVETPDRLILEVDLDSHAVARTFNVSSWLSGSNNSGLEALTFVPDAGNPEGGLFYAGYQTDGKIYKFQLPILSSANSTAVTFAGTITPVADRGDISGMDYDRENQTLYAIFDSANKLLAMDANGTFRQEWELPGNDQEGVALHGNVLYIAEDYGSNGDVVAYSPFTPVPEPTSALMLSTAVFGLLILHWRKRGAKSSY